MGNSIQCVGGIFTVVENYKSKFLYGGLKWFFLLSVVKYLVSHSLNSMIFYNRYGDNASVANYSEFMYVECNNMLSTASKQSGIDWAGRLSFEQQKRFLTLFIH